MRYKLGRFHTGKLKFSITSENIPELSNCFDRQNVEKGEIRDKKNDSKT